MDSAIAGMVPLFALLMGRDAGGERRVNAAQLGVSWLQLQRFVPRMHSPHEKQQLASMVWLHGCRRQRVHGSAPLAWYSTPEPTIEKMSRSMTTRKDPDAHAARRLRSLHSSKKCALGTNGRRRAARLAPSV